MKNKLIIWLLIVILMVTIINSISASYTISLNKIIYVDDDNTEGPWDGSQTYPFCRIQDAVDNASSEDLVFVYDGLYLENVFIDIPLTLQGIDKNTTIIDGNGIKDCIYLSSKADGTIIKGFTIQHAGNNSGGGFFDEGIDIHASNTIIYNNIIKDNPNNGIWLWCSNNNNISYNIIKNNHRAGIEANDLRYSTIYRNQFTKNYEWAVMLHIDGISIDNYIIENTFNNNDYKGMCLARQSGNFILRNNFINNSGGHARSDFTFLSRSSSYTNTWDENYWDDWNHQRPRRISGILSFDVDWNPVDTPYQFNGGK